MESFNKWNIQYFFKNKIKLKTSNSQKTVIFWAKMGCYVVDWSTKDKFEHFLKQYYNQQNRNDAVSVFKK